MKLLFITLPLAVMTAVVVWFKFKFLIHCLMFYAIIYLLHFIYVFCGLKYVVQIFILLLLYTTQCFFLVLLLCLVIDKMLYFCLTFSFSFNLIPTSLHRPSYHSSSLYIFFSLIQHLILHPPFTDTFPGAAVVYEQSSA